MKHILTLAISLLSLSVFSQTINGKGAGDSFEVALAKAIINFDEKVNAVLPENHEERKNNISFNHNGQKNMGAFSISIAEKTTISSSEANNELSKEVEYLLGVVLQYNLNEAKWVSKTTLEKNKGKDIKTSESKESVSINFNHSLLKDEFAKEGYYLIHTLKSEKYENGLSYFTHQVEVSKKF